MPDEVVSTLNKFVNDLVSYMELAENTAWMRTEVNVLLAMLRSVGVKVWIFHFT